jgi:GAF domain-containing protein
MRSESSEYSDLIAKLEAARESDVIAQALSAARERLGMDAAYLTTIDAHNQTVRGVVGPPELTERYQDSVLPLEQTYCMRMLTGEVPNVVRDTRADPVLCGLAASKHLGAYVGVPVTLSDGSVHGTLCCVSFEPKADLGEEERRFMQILAGIVAARVEHARGDVVRLTEGFRKSRRPKKPEVPVE